MSETRSSGVRNLRAMFENQNGAKPEDNSTPSRGRSPASSGHTTPARPLSKVRTSFVAVERPGETGPILGLRKQSDVAIEEAADEKSGLQESKPSLNGKLESLVENGTTKTSSAVDVKEPETVRNENEANIIPTSEKAGDEGGQKSTSNGGGQNDGMDKPDESVNDAEIKKDENNRQNMGDILRGSAIKTPAPNTQPEEESKRESPPKQASLDTTSKPTGDHAPVKSPTKPKDTPPQKRATPVKMEMKVDKPQAPLKQPATNAKKATQPTQISTSKAATSPKPAPKSHPTTPKSPLSVRTPKSPLSDGTPKTTKLKAVDTKPTATEAVKKPPRASNMPTTGTTASSRTRTAAKPLKEDPINKPQASPNTKAKTRSPTRPVRLPSHLTAPTASSVAKTHQAPPSRSPSRISNSNTALSRNPSTLRKDRATGTAPKTSLDPTPSIRKKTSRASLPSQSTTQKERPRSRVSNVSSRAPDEGFLARMMRPTASSASKVHDKVEVKSPPRRTATVKGKSLAGGKDEDKDRRPTSKGSSLQDIHEPATAEEPVSPSAGKTETLAASALDEGDGKQNMAVFEEGEPTTNATSEANAPPVQEELAE